MEKTLNFIKIKTGDGEMIINLDQLLTAHVGTSGSNATGFGINFVFEKNCRFISFPDKASAIKMFNDIWAFCQKRSGIELEEHA